jgi:hypothetical protein
MASSGMLHRVALVRTEVSEELSASFIRVTRIGEQGTTLAVTSNRRTLQEPHAVNIPENVILNVVEFRILHTFTELICLVTWHSLATS